MAMTNPWSRGAEPVPEALRDATVTVDYLGGGWRIHQLADGHRFSNDDLLTAWVAAHAMPMAERILDLGCGIGSVGLLTLGRMRRGSVRLVGVEVQEVSFRLAERTVALNGLADRVELRLGDLRHPGSVPERGAFDLVTGSPPYVPAHRGRISPHPQKASCRFELHGDVRDYCAVAARALAPAGRFVFCHEDADPRVREAIAAAGLALVAKQRVRFRPDQPPLIAVYVCAHASARASRADPPVLPIRTEDGQWSEAYRAVREDMDTLPNDARKPRKRRVAGGSPSEPTDAG